MFKKKLLRFAIVSLLIVVLAAVMVLWSSRVTLNQIGQMNTANALLNEHLQLSSTSYRLFKQLTDEILFGQFANQSAVRNKRAIIAESLGKIRLLEIQQREALGIEFTAGSIEDTDALEALIDSIIADFEQIVENSDPVDYDDRIRFILEERIDIGFREAINAAVTRQQNVVDALNSRIDGIHVIILWTAISLAILAIVITLAGVSSLLRAVERTREELEYQVAQRTAELTSANTALERSDSIRRNFLADISHELRTPLTIIRGEAQVALRREQRDHEEYRTALRCVLEQSVALSRLVDDLLFIARADSNSLRLNRQPVDVVRLLHSVVEDTRALSEHHQIQIECAEDSVASAVIDAERIRQLLVILIENAIRYSPANTQIILRAKISEADLIIVVEDFGYGIEANELPFIFERFYRGAQTSKHEQGMGLGLAVAKAIATAHGGRLTASSTVGEGTQMTVVLPRELQREMA
ncbi:two-component sensor histidine kinase [Pseudidiomarina aestuarii]|uniref:histidine kinase n=1 Tax=Pseudidiomarina aestuarii TaxID=624146 RepID=A0A7Z7ET54_9GAMM|nr:ATP-binding protein [Pseudidiomarina aestuarii]RUO39476.1 two-component sensor histidine kinase [Pseudidiomarina aestuarii]